MNAIPHEELTFEQALAALEKIVRELEDGQTGLEESLARYEKGVGLLKSCHQQLAQAEQRIVLVTGENENGKPVTRPFKHAATAETEAPKPPPAAPTAAAPVSTAPARKKPDGTGSLFG